MVSMSPGSSSIDVLLLQVFEGLTEIGLKEGWLMAETLPQP